MWAGSLTFDIGGQLVAVRFDTDDALERARLVFAAWLDDAAPEIAAAFSVRMGGAAPTGERRGVTEVPQLRFGSRVIARSRQPDDVMRALASVLGGVLAHQPADGSVWSGLRPFVRGDQVVLVDATPPLLVGDRRLVEAGIVELPSWTCRISAEWMVSVPPPLPQLHWAAASIDPVEPGAPTEPDAWRVLRLVGVVLHDTHEHDETCDHHESPGETLTRAAAQGTARQWFVQATELVEQGQVRVAHHRAELRDAITLSFATA